MIQTTIIPENTTLHINIPKNYVGKKVNAIFYIDEEITPNIEVNLAQKPSDIFEILSLEASANMHAKVGRKAVKISPLVESLTGVIPDDDKKSKGYYEYLTKKYS